MKPFKFLSVQPNMLLVIGTLIGLSSLLWAPFNMKILFIQGCIGFLIQVLSTLDGKEEI